MLKNIRKAIEDMEGAAMVRRNMGEHGAAEALHRWARTLKGAVNADEKEIELCQSSESTSRSSSTSDTSTN